MTSNQDTIDAYRSVQDRMTALVRDLDQQATSVAVPATPEWQVRDLVAHVVGITADLIAGNIDDAGSDPWTAAQVEQRRGCTVADLLGEWETTWPAFAMALDGLDPFRCSQVVFDVTTHEHDLRGALGEPGERDSTAVDIGWAWATAVVGQMRDGFSAGALEIRTEQGDVVVGAGEVTGSVQAGRFDLWRAMTGRRSAEQVRYYTWQGEPAISHLCLLPPRATPLVE